MVEDRIRALVRSFSSVQAETIKLLAESPLSFNLDDLKAVNVLKNRLRMIARPLAELEDLIGEWQQDVSQLQTKLLQQKQDRPTHE